MKNVEEILNKTELEQIRDLHLEINKNAEKRDNNLLTISTTIFAIVVSLTNIDSNNKLQFYTYLITVVLFLTSIISGFLLSNSLKHLYVKSLNKFLEQLSEKYTGLNKDKLLLVKNDNVYLLASYIFNYSTYLAIISLSVFTILRSIR